MTQTERYDHPENRTVLEAYGELLAVIDSWYAGAATAYPEHVRCGKGCSGCCRGLFDITLLDAALLQYGFARLPESVRCTVLVKAKQRLEQLQRRWPELSPPFILNLRPETEWEELMPDDDETPCPLLDDNGHCLVYAYRPMTCRLHGMPLIDRSGEVMHDEWCTENFTTVNPLQLPSLSAPFADIFRQEGALDRRFSHEVLGHAVSELDTFIPLALLYDITLFDWKLWWQNNHAALIAACSDTMR